ncbi:MAG: DUF3800 domain-containing protein [Desulfobaccales bacterium]
MAILRAYFDDSGDEDDPQAMASSLCGYIGHLENWQYFENEWQKTLKSHDVPYLHMKEFAHFKKPFKKYKHDTVARDNLLKDLVKVISDSQLEGIVSGVDLKDLRDYNEGDGINYMAYSLNLYTCMWIIGNDWPQTIVEMFLGKTNDVYNKIQMATRYARADTQYPKDDYIQVHPINKHLSFRDILPLQAADLLAYETRKDDTTTINRYEGVSVWPKISGHTLRKSLENLLISTNIIHNFYWDALSLAFWEGGGHIGKTSEGSIGIIVDPKDLKK